MTSDEDVSCGDSDRFFKGYTPVALDFESGFFRRSYGTFRGFHSPLEACNPHHGLTTGRILVLPRAAPTNVDVFFPLVKVGTAAGAILGVFWGKTRV